MDTKHEIQIATAVHGTLSGTTPLKGNIVDTALASGVTLVLGTGTVTDAGDASGFSTVIQHSDTTNDADFVTVSDDGLLGSADSLTVTDDTYDNKPVGSLGTNGGKRYKRTYSVGTANTSAQVHGFWILTGLAHNPPASAIRANISAT